MASNPVFSVVAARWRLALFVLLAVVGAAVALIQLKPQTYTARSSMLVETGRSTSDPGGRTLFGQEQRVYVATQVQVLNSERVSRAVGQSLSEEHKAYFRELFVRGGGNGDYNTWLADKLLKSSTISVAREANVIDVSVRAPTAAMAAEIANLFVKRYIDIAVDLRVQAAQQYLSFFEKQTEERRTKLESARLALNQYNQSRGLSAADDRAQNVESSRLADLSREVTLLEAQLAEVSSRDSEARERGGQMKDVNADPVITSMRNDLQRSRTALSQAQQSLGDNHPKVVELRQSITDLSARVERETARVVAGVGSEKSVIVQRLATLRAALAAQRSKVAGMEAARSQSTVLLADVESAQRGYDEIVKNMNQLRLESRGTLGNATLLEAASPPSKPSGISAPLILAVSVFFGTLLGIASVLVREVFDRRVRNDEQLASLVDLPVLVTVPSFSGRLGKPLGINPKRAISGRARRLTAS